MLPRGSTAFVAILFAVLTPGLARPARAQVTFDAVPGDNANEYHALSVEVAKPDTKLRTTAGYYTHTQPQAQADAQ